MKKKIFLFFTLVVILLQSCKMFTSNKPKNDEPEVTAIHFERQNVIIENGGNDYLRYTIEPSSIQNKTDVKFSYDESIIDIDADRYGIVITGKKSGQTYLKGTVNGITATCIVKVEGNPDIFEGEPYIYSNFTVVELTPGSNTTVTASLYGGTVTDLENFVWSIKDSDVASINYARGSCVITAKKTGSTQITVTHPDCKFGYTMIVFVYTDKLDIPYITTNQNIVVLNKAETSSRNITFDLRNSYSPNYQSGFSYEVVSDNNEPSFSFVGNANTAIITPVRNGLSVLRVSHSQCDYTLDVLVKVTTAVENVYITVNPSVLEIKGSDKSYSLFADIEGTDKYVDSEKFVWQILENETGDSVNDCLDYIASGNQLSIQGKKNGAFKVKVSHELSEYSRTAIIILKEQEGSSIDSSMYISTTANYVQTKVGEPSTEISVQLMGGEPGDENELEWKIENGSNNDICKIVTPTGKISARSAGSITNGNLIITPLKPGTATVTVSHPKILYSTDIVIKVLSEYALTQEPLYINSDVSLIKMLNGSTQNLSVNISGGKTSGDENGVEWSSEDSSVVSVSPSTGLNVVLSANGSGNNQTYINASHSKALSEKKILVLTADTQEALDSMKGIYTDSSYLRINVNGSGTLEMKSFGLETSDVQQINWSSSDSSVCTVQADSSNRLNATVYGYKIGTATVTAKLNGAEDCIFNITVLPEGEDTGVILPSYLTTVKNAVVITDSNGTAEISVTGINITENQMMNTVWFSEDTSVATVNGNGNTATVQALNEGRTRIKVSNPYSNNVLYIDVKVGALYEWADEFYVYITTEDDVVTMIKGETKTIGAALENSTQRNGFSFVNAKPEIVDLSGSPSGICILEALEAGMSEITIRNTYADFEKTILVCVANSKEELEGIKYLTTAQNVVTVGESYNQVVTVSIENSKDEILDGYNWQSSDNSVIKVVGSGNHAVFYGVKEGTAKVTVTNSYCEFPLEIIANCVDPILAAANPYITSQNIATVYVGDEPTTLTAELVGGNDSDNHNFSWHIQDSSIATLYSSNETAQLKAIKPGTTQIIISHPKAAGINRTILVICEPQPVSDCYITVTESIIKMSPTDSNKTITATLVNGSANDAYNFKWWADDYNIIDMNYTSESCVITPIATGNTTIHCSHPKAAYQKDIILYISQYSEFAFAVNSVTATQGKQTFVNMEVPSSNVKTKINYSVKKADGSGANSGICTVSGTDSVCIINPLQTGQCIIQADLVAVNSGILQATAQLLLNIEPSNIRKTYISYTGDTVITMEKDQRNTFKATLAGENAVTGDENYIKWKVSDPSVLSISPSPSLSGYTMNKEVQITALKSGKEATITISHEKADDNVILYVIIPGENVANILLDRTAMNLIQGDSPQMITASITNALEGDYENLEWTVQQDESNPVIKISGSGRKISVLPKAVGSAVITATVPSSLRKATCQIKVEPPKQIILDRQTIKCYPGECFTINYTVSPESETNSIVWSVTDTGFVSYQDNKKGTLTVMARYREGITSITGTTKSLAVATCNVNVGWGNTFTLSKSMIKTIPEDNGDGTFDIDFEIQPPCAEIEILGIADSKISLKDGSYSELITVNNQKMYRIKPEKYTRVDTESGTAYGTIRLKPDGEFNGRMTLKAYNPVSIDGQPPQGYIGSDKYIDLQIYYPKYDFVLENFKITKGKYSSYDRYNNIITMGDGETVSFTISTLQPKATPLIKKVEMKAVNPNSLMNYGQKKNNSGNNYVGTVGGSSTSEDRSLMLCEDFCYNGSNGDGFWHNSVNDTNDPTLIYDQKYNKTVLEHLYVGTLEITYTSRVDDSTKKATIPVYLDIRNCACDY